ncbi:hypothetical protein LCGC14_1626160 [marine sediment metagenome]|uniref:Uncharacterized protein n=1 Tax=marine sediment metagenome TaxID=412755 RepID=A0A0F9KJL1_9ZZZZ
MGRLTSRIVPGDWNSVAHAIARLDARLNTDSSPTFSGVGLTGLTENALMYADGDGVLTSLSVASNGQLIIGSTGVAPSVAALTGTANQVIVTPGAGSITLSTPQNIHTGASPTFAGGTFTQVVTGIDPVNSNHLATKEYVDSAISFINDFFLTDDASTGGYFDAAESPTGAAVGTLTTTGLTEGDGKALDGFITPSGFPGVTTLMAGVYDMHFHMQRSAGNRDYTVYFELYTRTTGGAETLRTTSEISSNFDDDNDNDIDIHATIASDVVINATDRLVWKLFANMGVGNNTNLDILTEGTTNSHVSLPTTTEILSSVFVRQDGTTELSGNWGVGGFDITGIGALGSGAITSSGASTFNSGSVDADFTVNWNTGVGLFVQGSDGGVGIGTTTIPHGGVGWAKFAIDGTNASVAGPHVQFTISSDNYPLMQILNYRHDDISIRFDSYWDGANKSSDAGSNYAIFKVSDLFKIMYDSGVAKGAAVAWNDGIVLNTSGLVTIAGTLASGAITQSGTTLDNTYQPLDAGLTSLAGLTYAAASFVKMTGANAFALRTIGETADDLEGTIVHDNLASIPANDHIDHTGVTLTAGLGLTGSGDISANRTFDMDIGGLSEDTTPQATADYVATYDNSASTHKKVLVEDLGPFGSVSRTQTVNLLQADSAADMQTKIDALGKYIPNNQVITFQFETGGTHTLDTVITFSGFFGTGVVVIQGNTGEAGAETKHTTQDTVLNFNNDTSGLDILNTEVYMHIRNLKIIVESDVVDAKCINADVGNRVEVSWNYFVGNSTTKGRGFLARYCRYARSYQCLFDNVKYGLTGTGSRLHAWDNDDTGTQPLYGIWANQISYVGKQSTQISGSTANELVDAGSQII